MVMETERWEKKRGNGNTFKLCHGTYKSKSTSIQAKLKHWCLVVKPAPAHCADTSWNRRYLSWEKGIEVPAEDLRTQGSIRRTYLTPKDRPEIVRLDLLWPPEGNEPNESEYFDHRNSLHLSSICIAKKRFLSFNTTHQVSKLRGVKVLI